MTAGGADASRGDLIEADFGPEGSVVFRLTDRVPFSLNPTAAFLFRLLREGRSTDQAAGALAEEFDIDRADAKQDVLALIAGLEKEGLCLDPEKAATLPPVPPWRHIEEKMMAEPQQQQTPPEQPDAPPPIPEGAVPRVVEEELVFREEEEGAFLFHPESSDLSALNPVGVMVWKEMDGGKTVKSLADAVHATFPDVALDQILDDVRTFLSDLNQMGYVAWD